MTRIALFRQMMLLVVLVGSSTTAVGALDDHSPLAVGATTRASTLADSPTGHFATRVVEGPRGDVIAISIQNAKGHVVTLGSPDSGFELNFTVKSGGATVLLNTFKAGRSSYTGEWLTVESGSIGPVHLRSHYVSAPLEPGYYPMKIEFNGTESDVGGLVVENRSTNASAGWVLPKGFEFDDKTTAGAIATSGRERGTNLSVAQDDWLALEVNASGLYGILEADGTPDISQLDGSNGISVSFEQLNPPPNRAPNTFSGEYAEHFYTDAEADRFFLVIDTARHDIEPGDVYNATFRVTPDSGLVDHEENRTITFRVAERTATIDYRGRKLTANATGKTVVSGSTTMVAGTEFQIRAKHEGQPPFLEVQTVTVDENGTFETTFDFATIPVGTNFTIRIPETGTTVPAVVRDVQLSTPTPTPTPTPTNTTTPNATPSPTPTPTVTPTVEFTTNRPIAAQKVVESTGQPGFGVFGPLVVLLVGGLLARRTEGWYRE